MIAAENPAVKVGMIRATAWSEAVQQLRGSVPTGDEMLGLEWEAAGIVGPDGALDPDWARALRVTQDAQVGAEVVSVYRGIVFSATLFSLGADLVCVTARATFREDDLDGATATVIDTVHPMLEVALAPSADPWLLLRRVLPPLDALRADPRAPEASEVTPLELDGVEIPERLRADVETFASHMALLPTLPQAVADAVDPQASVFAFSLRADRGALETSSRAWSLGKRGLYRVEPETARAFQVPRGDLGHHLVEALR